VFEGKKAFLADDRAFRIHRRIASAEGAYWAALSPDGHQCATWALGAKIVQVWDADDDLLLATLNAPNAGCLLFSPDGHWLLTGTPEEYIFWERASWKPLHTIPRGMNGGTGGKADFSSDGRLIALFVGRGEIEILDAITFAPLAVFESPDDENAVSDVTFSPDSTQLAVGTQGQEIRIWNLPLVRKQLASLKLDWSPSAPQPASINSAKPIKFVIAGSPASPAPDHLEEPQPKSKPTSLNFPPRDPACTPKQIDLSAYYNATLTSSWINSWWTNNNLASLPRGLRILDRIEFDIRGIVQLSCSHPDLAFDYPTEVTGIPVRQPCQTLHFLHSASWGYHRGGKIGEYVVRYQNGTELSVPLVYDQNTSGWWYSEPLLEPDTTVAWTGVNPFSAKFGKDLLLFHFRWENPRPEFEIDSITFRSAMTDCAPFLIAITAE
jgi:hypothetical protein